MMNLQRLWLLPALFAVSALAMIESGCASSRQPTSYADPGEMIASPRAQWRRTTQDAGIVRAEPSPSEELWIIARNDIQPPTDPTTDLPTTGSLIARLPNPQTPAQIQSIPVPLKHTDVKASIAGYIASVDVTQQFTNPFNSKIEAVYVFPLPHNAAITEFIMTIGDRRIRGIIRERAEAERIYQSAKSQGYVASLLTQDRPNIFTQAVANIEPGKLIDINIRYFHTLTYSDGWYEWHFPMVVGPRFNPPNITDGIGAVVRGEGSGFRVQERADAGRIAGVGAMPQKTEVQYLKPTERSGHDISLSVNIEAGVKIEELTIPTHRAEMRSESSSATIKLSANDSIPNKDFLLRFRVAGDKPKSALLAHRDEKGGYFTLLLYPPQSLAHLSRKPLEMVFVIDYSGSMEGKPLAQAKAATRAALERMRPDDTFQIVRFSDDAQLMSDKPLPATPENIRRAKAYLDQPYGGGGTMMLTGISKSLDFPHDQSRLRFVCFLTDGFIGNETEILREIHGRLGPSRIFSFGVGPSVNRYLLDHMARMGRGAAAYLTLDEKAEPVMDGFFERISHPALTDLQIDFGGMKASDVFPDGLPDLFVGRPVILSGKFTGNGKTTVRIKGSAGGEIHEFTMNIDLDAPGASHPALRPIWARTKIADLADRSAWDPAPNIPAQIKDLALEHGLMSPYTAFIAVDATKRTDGTWGTTVAVPVPVPEGVKYETTVPTK